MTVPDVGTTAPCTISDHLDTMTRSSYRNEGRGAAAALGGLLVFCAVAAAACGDDGATPSNGGTLAADWPVQRSWQAGDRIGYAFLDHQRRAPETLAEAVCTLDIQLAEATAAGSLLNLDVTTDGGTGDRCVITDQTAWSDGSAGLVPACAGAVQLEVGGLRRGVTVCAEDTLPPPIALDCVTLTDASMMVLRSGPDELDGDVLGSLNLSVVKPPVPRVLRPEVQGEGTGRWPAGDLEIRWEAGDGGAIEIVLSGAAAEPRVRCLVADDGVFVLPGDFADPYRAARAAVEVARISQQQISVDGFAFRASYRVSDSLWLYPNPAP